VNFCTDTASFPEKTDEGGYVVFVGTPETYHVQIVSVPEGYSFSKEDEINTSVKAVSL